jgi:hypothetical protein
MSEMIEESGESPEVDASAVGMEDFFGSIASLPEESEPGEVLAEGEEVLEAQPPAEVDPVKALLAQQSAILEKLAAAQLAAQTPPEVPVDSNAQLAAELRELQGELQFEFPDEYADAWQSEDPATRKAALNQYASAVAVRTAHQARKAMDQKLSQLVQALPQVVAGIATQAMQAQQLTNSFFAEPENAVLNSPELRPLMGQHWNRMVQEGKIKSVDANAMKAFAQDFKRTYRIGTAPAQPAPTRVPAGGPGVRPAKPQSKGFDIFAELGLAPPVKK